MAKALIEKDLLQSTILQLERAENPLWSGNGVRKTVRDIIDATSVPDHIIINPNSNTDYQIEVGGAFDGKSVIYAAFGLALNKYAILYPGRHEEEVDLSAPRTLKAVSFRPDQNGKWHCFRVQNKGFVEIKFRDTDDPYVLHIRENYQNTHDMFDLVVQGAYCDVDLSKAPGLYNYFCGLLAMTPEKAKETIDQHENNKIAQEDAWRKSKETEPADSFVINGEEMSAQVVEGLDERITAEHAEQGYKFTVNPKNLAFLTQLSELGYTLTV